MIYGNREEMKEFRAYMTQMYARTPEHVKQVIKHSEELRQLYLQAQQEGTLDKFLRERKQRYRASSDTTNKDEIIASLQKKVFQLENQLVMARADLFIRDMK